MKQLYTKWGKQLDNNNVLPEYPRPMLERDNFEILNGLWEYAITSKYERPKRFDGKIVVPFSPESALSGVRKQIKPSDFLWYKKSFSFDTKLISDDMHLILHFGAVDQLCRVFINGREAARHSGGYLPFSVDVTEYLESGKDSFELCLAVKDLSDTSIHSRGKQKLKRGGMFYTAQSGIWKTVWMEYVPKCHVKRLEVSTDIESSSVTIKVISNIDTKVKITIKEPHIYDNNESSKGKNVIKTVEGVSNVEIRIHLEDVKLWDCTSPYLYYFDVQLNESDMVTSYFAMREFKVKQDENGFPRIMLNGVQTFFKGVLDQGYWSDGLYTAPSDEALIYDIQTMKDLGFNMIRKHLKIESERWYYHCDRLGMVVWQDMVNGGGYYKHWFVTYMATLFVQTNKAFKDNNFKVLSRMDKRGQKEFVHEMRRTIELLKNHPCISTWVIFNEGWGQFSADKVTTIAKNADPSRLIDQASGWFDQSGGDIQSIHNYFFALTIHEDTKRAAALTEFGGYTWKVPYHAASDKLYGYGTCKNEEEFRAKYLKRDKEIMELQEKGLCASVYTQLSDVEDEINGLLTFDREVLKLKL